MVLLSLAGGPSFLLVSGIGCFRSYGRAGLLAVALWCVAAPVILHHSLRVLPFRLARPVVLVALLGLSLYEGHQAIRWSPLVPRDQTPAWVDWLGRHPRERLAAFPLSKQWEFDSLPYRIRHRHACLNPKFQGRNRGIPVAGNYLCQIQFPVSGYILINRSAPPATHRRPSPGGTSFVGDRRSPRSYYDSAYPGEPSTFESSAPADRPPLCASSS